MLIKAQKSILNDNLNNVHISISFIYFILNLFTVYSSHFIKFCLNCLVLEFSEYVIFNLKVGKQVVRQSVLLIVRLIKVRIVNR